MLRKYGIGLMAIIMGVAMAAFTAPKKAHLDATNVFEFNPSLSYTVPNVTTTGNWQYLGDISQFPLCEGESKACRVAVTNSYVDNPSNPGALSGVTISASTAGTGTAHVTGITDQPENMYSNEN